ncbi:unnamed protein product [Orchesella dallaii]|uniref:MARVEL domain-containing protein n=1 Tax=Orchesella dallaii TaxID=48710 RepID=A0ABP1QVJ9_9HEXA
MVSNFQYIRSTPGTLKSISIVLTITVVALSFVGHFASNYTSKREDYRHLFTKNELRSLWREYFLMGAALICLIVSTINLIAHLVSRELYWNKRTAIYDFLYHSGSVIVIGVAGMLYIVSGVKIFEINCTTDNECQQFEVKLGAGGLALVLAILNGVIGSVVLTNRKDVEREVLIEDK